jgi:hypothetical protein
MVRTTLRRHARMNSPQPSSFSGGFGNNPGNNTRTQSVERTTNSGVGANANALVAAARPARGKRAIPPTAAAHLAASVPAIVRLRTAARLCQWRFARRVTRSDRPAWAGSGARETRASARQRFSLNQSAELQQPAVPAQQQPLVSATGAVLLERQPLLPGAKPQLFVASVKLSVIAALVFGASVAVVFGPERGYSRAARS